MSPAAFLLTGPIAVACALLLAPAARAAGPADADPPPLVRTNHCLQCHDVDQDRGGPSFRKIAAKYKGDAQARKRLVRQMARGETARFPDGHEQAHRAVKTSPPRDMAQITNLVQWILAQ